MIKPLVSLLIIPGLIITGLLAADTYSASAQERRTITVRSQDYGYYYYRVNTGNHVSLTRQLSRTACEYNRNWGYDYRGVWVDKGCEAEFEVGGSGSYRPNTSSSSSDGRREIYVSSPNYRYYKYNIQTDNEVELVRQLSNSPCDKNRTWGYDRNGVWVNQGCSGQFLVGKRPGGSNTGRNVAVGSAIAGGVVLAAILAARAKNKDHANDEVPDWMVGTFRGYNPTYDTTADITIYDGGSVSLRAGNRPTINGSYRDNQIEMGGLKFKITKERNGFRTTEVGREDNQVSYTRIY